MSELYERIIDQTNKLGINGVELARLLGLKKSPLTDWKNKKSSPTLEQLLKMCEIFATSSDYLLYGKKNFLSEKESTLIEYYRRMSPCDQEDFLLIAKMKYDKTKSKNVAKSSLSSENNSSSESA